MRLHGYCTECHRFKLVSVAAHNLVMVSATRMGVQGVCADCEEQQRAKVQERATRR